MATRQKPRHKSPPQGTRHLTPKQMTALAARKYHVPFWLLWGVKVVESGPSGTGIGAVSSAGAQGPFQFLPSTASEYGVNVNSFQSSAYGAAHYLSDLKKSTGSWSSALEHYSGGGYGVSHVEEGARSSGVSKKVTSKRVLADIKTPLGTIPFPGPELDFTNPLGPLSPVDPRELGLPGEVQKGGAGKGIESLIQWPKELLDAANATTALLTLLTKPEFWIRVAEGVGGIILLYMALKSLTGTGVSDIPGGSAATSYAKAAAFKRLPPAQRVK